MFRLIRRAPWIALGAAGAYYMDKSSGPARRAQLKQKAFAMKDQWMGSRTGGGGSAAFRSEPPLQASLTDDVIGGRRQSPLAEETSAGVASPAPTPLAERILEDSERRVTDRPGTVAEERRSEDTVPPVEAGGFGYSTGAGELGALGNA